MSGYMSLLKSKQMQVLFFVIFVEPVSLFILYPFVYFMVRDFHVVSNNLDLGTYVGLLAASFSISQFLTSVPWGYASNKIGRRPVILIGLFGNTVTSVLFGLSKNYQWAIITRTICGLLNGNIAIAKIVIREIIPDEQHGLAFSLFGFAFGLGSIVASALGGLLANVCDKYPAVFGTSGVFKQFPYLLPCLFSASFSLFGFILGYCYLKESLRSSTPELSDNDDDDEEATKYITDSDSDLDACSTDKALKNEGDRLSSRIPMVDGDVTVYDIQMPLVAFITHEDSTPIGYLALKKRPVSSSWSAFTTISSYMLLAMMHIINQEVLVLLMTADVPLGGFGWDSAQVGYSMVSQGVMLMIVQLFLYPYALKFRGLRLLFRDSMLLQVPVFFMTGWLSLLVGRTVWLWTAMTVHHLFRVIAQACAFTSVMVMVNNSATMRNVGIVNGVGQSGASLVRAIGPALGGTLWEFSLKSRTGYPFDYQFVFVLLAIVSVVAFLWSFSIPKQIETANGSTSASSSTLGSKDTLSGDVVVKDEVS